MTTILTREEVRKYKEFFGGNSPKMAMDYAALDLIATLEVAWVTQEAFWALADKYRGLWEASVGPLFTQEELDAEYEKRHPSAEDLRGMSPDFTGDRSTREHLRKLRQKDD